MVRLPFSSTRLGRFSQVKLTLSFSPTQNRNGLQVQGRATVQQMRLSFPKCQARRLEAKANADFSDYVLGHNVQIGIKGRSGRIN